MGELARKPGCPELPKTPLELLTPRPGEGFSVVEKLAWPVGGVLAGFGGVLLMNWAYKRPIWAAVHWQFMAALVGGYIFTKIGNVRFAGKAEADAILKHYITLHPDDFPPYERKRWRDVYMRFDPVR